MSQPQYVVNDEDDVDEANFGHRLQTKCGNISLAISLGIRRLLCCLLQSDEHGYARVNPSPTCSSIALSRNGRTWSRQLIYLCGVCYRHRYTPLTSLQERTLRIPMIIDFISDNYYSSSLFGICILSGLIRYSLLYLDSDAYQQLELVYSGQPFLRTKSSCSDRALWRNR